MGQIFVATPQSLVEFQEQVRAIPEGYVEFYMHDDSLDLFIPEAQAALLKSYGLEFRVIKALDSDKIKLFYEHIPSAVADLAHRQEAIKSAVLARDGIAAFCLGYNCENEVEDDLEINGFRYLPFVHLAPQGVRTYLFKLVFTKDEAAEIMGEHFEAALVDAWRSQLPVDNLTAIFGVDESIDETDI
ncbi:MAG TPA: hypothetical protein VLK82_06750 [Candidatus Tectomicrobia bacterium]|nr:hypothetical protein [Candidatus Tectomicrobia bacterium]